ncbi:hypothetical protein QTP88_010072 [Uroleucon formosanum]
MSLNRALHPGPKLQTDIVNILIRFRLFRHAFTADIFKMYRQILILPEFRVYQHILWRDSPLDQLIDYELNTVTYGVNCTPFLALRVLRAIADNDGESFPRVRDAICHQTYVDDICYGADTIAVQSELNSVLARSGVELRKWSSNTPAILQAVPADHCVVKSTSFADDDSVGTKDLGIHWYPNEDYFCSELRLEVSPTFTKRGILSLTAQFFDPLGLFAPTMFLPKHIMQRTWQAACEWDGPLPCDIRTDWAQFVIALPQLSTVRVPRVVNNKKKIMKRVYLSGAAKRKAKNNKKLKEEKGKHNLYDLGWCSSSRNLIQNDINEQQCDIDDLEVLENKKEPSIHVGDPKKTQIDDTVVLYPKENTENVINTQNNELVENVQMNENECVKEIDENVIDNNIFCFKGIIEANSNKPSAEMFKLSNDPATWKKLSSSDRDYLAAAGPPTKPSKFPHDEHENHSFPISVFQKTLPNKETVQRDWLVWSTLKKALFCFPCCLFLRDDDFESSSFCRNGIGNNWRKLYDKIDNHEGNKKHIERYLLWKDLVEAINGRKGIDKDLQISINTEKEKWRKLLRVLVDITLFLAENNLPFRGTHSTIDYDDCGLFISTAKLVSHYSETMKNHLDTIKEYKDSSKKMSAHYLSPRSQNEFLEICAKKVQQKIIEEIKKCQYYAIIVDGTPDVSHKEQLV